MSFSDLKQERSATGGNKTWHESILQRAVCLKQCECWSTSLGWAAASAEEVKTRERTIKIGAVVGIQQNFCRWQLDSGGDGVHRGPSASRTAGEWQLVVGKRLREVKGWQPGSWLSDPTWSPWGLGVLGFVLEINFSLNPVFKMTQSQ